MINFNEAIKSGYFMYMAEAEGFDNLVNTRQAKLNAVRKELPFNPSYTDLEAVCLKHGLSTISEQELNYITNK